MLDLYDEFVTLVAALDGAHVPYAVCGGLAMAIHGLPRATVDVDLLVPMDVAATRAKIGWERGDVWAVSRQGLIALKRLRGSGQDQDDIKRLQETDS
jgi:hypothetical protein